MLEDYKHGLRHRGIRPTYLIALEGLVSSIRTLLASEAYTNQQPHLEEQQVSIELPDLLNELAIGLERKLKRPVVTAAGP